MARFSTAQFTERLESEPISIELRDLLTHQTPDMEISECQKSCKLCSFKRDQPSYLLNEYSWVRNILAKNIFVTRNISVRECLDGEMMLSGNNPITHQFVNYQVVMGIQDSECEVIPALNCPVINDDRFEIDWFLQCAKYKLGELSKYPVAKNIFLLGDDVVRQWFGADYSIMQLVGYTFKTEKYNIIPLFHPAFVVRNRMDKEIVEVHLKHIRRLFEDGVL